jgi:DNA-binding transcriptional MerR regulator
MDKTQGPLPEIPAKRYFTIGEVGELCGVKPYVLRYWEQEFTQLRPVKRRGNRRYYQHHEVLLIRRIRDLLYEQGFTISGARNRLAAADPAEGSQSPRVAAQRLASSAPPRPAPAPVAPAAAPIPPSVLAPPAPLVAVAAASASTAAHASASVALPALSALPAAALATGLDTRDEHLLRVELLTIRQLLEI